MINYFRRLRLYWTVVRRLGAIIDVANRKLTLGNNGWITTKYGKFYVRVGRMSLPPYGLVGRGVTLASVEIVERYQRKAFFKVGLRAIEEQAKANRFDAVVIENILNDDIRPYLIRCGYEPREYEPISLIKVF
jgi:hypothetical protein